MNNKDSNERDKEMLKMRQSVLEAEEQRIRGDKTYSIDEIRNMLKERLKSHE